MIGAGFMLGLAGSLHCVGMCGPLAMAVPGLYSGKINKWLGAFLYHIGRSFTYAIFGLIFGALGKSISLAGMQSWVSILAGAIMIVMGLIPFFQSAFEKFFTKVFYRLKINSLRNKLLQKPRNPFFIVLLGSLNGLLPCGLVYVALAGALGTGNPILGAAFMFVFGLGTLPALYLLSVGGRYALSLKGFNAARIISSITIIVGLIFVLRGADLGIRFISPKHEALKVKEATVKAQAAPGSCCTAPKENDSSAHECH
ncbi:membrane protein [Thermaurantimonas aggregans]|uniref:Membrane protein n=1 Tax=Thermaurantimonas aggregans TaxID=2173829 RepID=A0A401XKA2_9FLAO|nr:sulfite exporter TauE/SafE family protein [Thermaurantimonas aggregans]MCX8148354.1 sulfite exporter TauE/SafE family protein [Thermaurantimonas aggregans]GCD77456.1 membrane protein [Thermaurantimonas aggregans]